MTYVFIESGQKSKIGRLRKFKTLHEAQKAREEVLVWGFKVSRIAKTKRF